MDQDESSLSDSVIKMNSDRLLFAVCRASYLKKLDIVRECIADLNAIDLTAKSEEGKTALDYAKQWGFSEIEAELTKALQLTAEKKPSAPHGRDGIVAATPPSPKPRALSAA